MAEPNNGALPQGPRVLSFLHHAPQTFRWNSSSWQSPGPMRFLELNEIAQWCSEHGIAVGDNWKPTHPSSTRVVHRIVYADGRRSGREQASAAECVGQLGQWSGCLLFVLQWGVWSSTEDWPAYYAARGGSPPCRPRPPVGEPNLRVSGRMGRGSRRNSTVDVAGIRRFLARSRPALAYPPEGTPSGVFP